MKPLASISGRAFSLIEVMIAILILALGLLGLGAVIPVVVKQQRSSADTTLGIAAARAAEAYLRNRPEFDPNSTSAQNAWANWLSTNTPNWNQHLWEVPAPIADLNSATGGVVEDTGDMLFTNSAVGPNSSVVIGIGDRLWPSASSQPVQTVEPGLDPYRPQFVWDIVGRRIKVDSSTNPPTISSPPQIQVAIFVRRIDANIPLPRIASGGNVSTLKLIDILTGQHGAAAVRCVPVAVEDPNQPIPTNRGTNSAGNRVYGVVQEIAATFRPASRDLIVIPNTNNQDLIDLAARPDQKLVDNFGNVYTVREVVEDPLDPNYNDSTIVRVTPSVPTSIGDPLSIPLVEDRFRQLIFTPQIPGTVRVFTITRPK